MVQKMLEHFDRLAPGMSNQPTATLGAVFENAQAETRRADQAALELSDDLRRTLQRIVDR